MTTKKWLVVLGAFAAAGALLSGCATPGLLSTGTPQAPLTPTPAPTQTDVAYSGSQTCAYQADDGEYNAIVVIENTRCASWPSALAHDGKYWTDLGSSAASSWLTQTDPATSQICQLTAGSMTLTVFDSAGNVANPISAGVAEGVCTSEEQNGWTPKAP